MYMPKIGNIALFIIDDGMMYQSRRPASYGNGVLPIFQGKNWIPLLTRDINKIR